jgi:hypothetical protein
VVGPRKEQIMNLKQRFTTIQNGSPQDIGKKQNKLKKNLE